MSRANLISRRYWPIVAIYAFEIACLLIVAVSTEQLESTYRFGYLAVAVPVIVGLPFRWDFVRYLWPAWSWLVWGTPLLDDLARGSSGIPISAIGILYPATVTWVLWFTKLGREYFSQGTDAPVDERLEQTQQLPAASEQHLIVQRRTRQARADNTGIERSRVRGYWIGILILIFGWQTGIWWAHAIGLAIVVVSFCMLRKGNLSTSS